MGCNPTLPLAATGAPSGHACDGSSRAARAQATFGALLGVCDTKGRVPPAQRGAVRQLIHVLERGLA